MKVIIDTNVIISATMTDGNARRVLLQIVNEPRIEWIASIDILAEYEEVLCRPKFKFPSAVINRWKKLIREQIKIVESGDPPEFIRDPADAKFLACARSRKADYLISGDRALVESAKFGSTTILTVSLFGQLISNWSP